MKRFLSILYSLIGIVVSAGTGTLISYVIVAVLGLQGAVAVTAMLLLSMVTTFAVFVLGIIVLRALQPEKTGK